MLCTLVYRIDVQYKIKFTVGKILKKTLNVQDRIDVQGGKFPGKSIIVQGEINVQGGIEKTQYLIEDLCASQKVQTILNF